MALWSLCIFLMYHWQDETLECRAYKPGTLVIWTVLYTLRRMRV